jgi:tetratricopeptide (TPR) repeat protein
VHLCYPKEDVYLDLHLSKAHYEAADEWLFRMFLDGVRIHPVPSAPRGGDDRSTGSGSSLDLFHAGSQFYVQGNYPQAITLYQEAFDLEQGNPQLDRIMWRQLVDNLGMAYGISGKLVQARATFEFGTQQDHTYPLFHYHLACTLAEMDDRARAMQSLKTAFQHRRNHNPGEPGVPDPRRDPSFRRFMTEDGFRKFVDQLMTQSG